MLCRNLYPLGNKLQEFSREVKIPIAMSEMTILFIYLALSELQLKNVLKYKCKSI